MAASPSRIRRWTFRAGIALLVAYLLYLLAGNAFLHSELARELTNRKPEKFRMAWSGGHTLWPGVVTLREVRMQGHVRRTLWSVQAQRASGRIALWPLLRREIRVPRVDATSVTGSVARAPTELPPPESRPGGWTLRMDRIASDSIAGGEVFGWKIAGKGRAEVGFSKQFRGGPAELFASEAHFLDTTASRDGEDWLRDMRVDATFALARHLSAEYPGLAKLPLFSATLEIDGKTVVLRSTLDETGRYRFDAVPGEGRITGTLALSGGELAQGGTLRVHAPLHAIDPAGVESSNALELSLDVAEGMHLRAQVPERPEHMSFDLDLQLPGRALPLQDWRQRLVQATGTASGRWQVPSIGALVRLFAQADWLALEGSGTVEADLRLAGGRLVEGSRLQARDVEAHADVLGNRFSGRAQADAVIEAGEDGQARSRVNLAMQRFGVAPGSAPSRPYVEGNDLRVDLVSDARLDRMRETSQARIRFNRARIPDLAVFNPYLPNDKLRFGGGSGTLTGDLRVDGEGDVGEGTLRVDGRNARLAVAGIDLRGDVAIDGRLRRGSLERGNFELGGTRVSARNLAFTDRGTSRTGWWATLDLDGGHVAWKQPSSAGGKLRARMKDVDFLLAMFADRADYPAWIGKVVDAGEVRLDGRWEWRGDTLVLDRMRAENERFQLDARMKLQGRDRSGDLYAKWGVLGVGVELQGGERKLHLRKAREWYDGRPHLLR
ncbi:hypothetical protein FQY83_06305 [Luteimonas marina]|uniref:Translocation/assembly module TamB n=1 Tax=Luteimonas marina TaxID=488485 RepID=A0A5C5U9U6_9GAMM|nr:hypothetical protein [Luteimonas marina]TWT22623.1 hypothetical protein FQY83_06305 [Luteimonas marina]